MGNGRGRAGTGHHLKTKVSQSQPGIRQPGACCLLSNLVSYKLPHTIFYFQAVCAYLLSTFASWLITVLALPLFAVVHRLGNLDVCWHMHQPRFLT